MNHAHTVPFVDVPKTSPADAADGDAGRHPAAPTGPIVGAGVGDPWVARGVGEATLEWLAADEPQADTAVNNSRVAPACNTFLRAIHSITLPIAAGFPVGALALLGLPSGLEEDRRQRRQRQHEAVQVSVPADRGRIQAAQVALTAPAIYLGIAVQQLSPMAFERDPDLVVVARDRGEVESCDDQIAGRQAVAHHADHALLVVAGVDPAEAGRVEVDLVQRVLRAKDAVQVPDPPADARVMVIP